MEQICPHCKKDNISQEVTFLIDPNNLKDKYEVYPAEITYQDWYWCNNCYEEITPIELSNQTI